jgi:hypothetical protein
VSPATFDVVLHRALQAMKKNLGEGLRQGATNPGEEPSEVRPAAEATPKRKEARNA